MQTFKLIYVANACAYTKISLGAAFHSVSILIMHGTPRHTTNECAVYADYPVHNVVHPVELVAPPSLGNANDSCNTKGQREDHKMKLARLHVACQVPDLFSSRVYTVQGVCGVEGCGYCFIVILVPLISNAYNTIRLPAPFG